MMPFAIFFLGLCLFLLGFFFGASRKSKIKTYKLHAVKDEASDEFTKEYQNFLNYDGSMQV